MQKPSWLTTYDNDGLYYGFDTIGLWFSPKPFEEEGGEGGEGADNTTYPVRTNFDIPGDEVTTVIFTFIHTDDCSDQGICVFSSSVAPNWSWGPEETRIAFSMNCPTPELAGQLSEVEGCGDVLVVGQTYTGKFVYNPSTGVVAGVYLGATATGEPICEVSLEETLPDGPYRVGFSADLDEGDGSKAYFTRIIVNGRDTADVPISSCDQRACPSKFTCFLPTQNRCTCTTWRYFYPHCSRANIVAGNCSATRGAYVPAITVCNQRLF